MIWPLLLGAVLLLAACDRKSPSPGKGSDSKARSSDHADAAQQGAGNSVSDPSANSPSSDSPGDPLLSAQTPENTPAEFPSHGSPLRPEEAHRLLSGTIIFNPKSIPSSDRVIEPDTPIDVGQDLQVKYGNTWWAGTVLGFEADGRVRIHYYGWAASYDEAKPRAELQLDGDARVHALDSTYVRDGW